MQVMSKTGQMPSGFAVPPGRDGLVPTHDVRAAAFSFEELAKWYGPFTAAVASTEWYTTDIDERLNRLTAEVENVTATARALQAAGVPPTVYVLARGVPSVLDIAPVAADLASDGANGCANLTALCRPVLGGLQISSSAGTCTLGINIDHHLYGPAFLTNAHCTDAVGQVTGIQIGQSSPSDVIGTEVYDPPLIEQSALPPGVCSDNHCRYADVAVIQYNSSASTLGEIGDPLGDGQETSVLGVLDETPWQIDQEEDFPYVGQEIWRIGRTSGETITEVVGACKNTGWPGVNATLLCQYEVARKGQGGDSGGPYFWPLGPWWWRYT